MLWADKYKPKSLEDFAGQKKQIEMLKRWYNGWSYGDKALFLHGPPGSGKTTSVYALANDKNLELFELNASDDRNKHQIESLAGSASKQMSLTNRNKIILIDEVDGLSGNKDRGGVSAIIKTVKESKFPVVLTANDPYESKLRSMRRYCEMVDFGKVHLSSMTAFLSKICSEEGVEAERSVLKRIARKNAGDMRSAINDLEAIGRGQDSILKEDLEALGFRSREKEIFEVLKVIFKTRTAKTAKNLAGDSDKDPDELFWWIEQNIPKEYKKQEDVAKAFDEMSKASLFKARIRRRQNWSLMKYYIGLMSAGVALAKDEKYSGFTRYQPPQRLKRYGRSKASRRMMDEIYGKIGNELHVSPSTMKLEYIPLFKWLIRNKGDVEEELGDLFDLTEKELDCIKKF